jgi:NAD(P)-dependent dehydrogenase (short-subunit alcohol dehydrogenase family)
VEQGAALVLADIDEPRTQQGVAGVKAKFPNARIKGIVMDAGDEGAIRKAVQQTVQEFGRLDIMIIATYKAVGKLVEELTAEEFDAANHVNLTGAFCLAREAAAVMKTGGSIVVYSSIYGLVAPDPDMYAPPRKPNPIEYGMGKAAVVQMVKYLASYWGCRGIRVNGIAPGPFPHPRGDAADPDFVQLLVKKVPMGRIGRREETAGAVVFLASDDASYITGQTLAVDGGWTAR